MAKKSPPEPKPQRKPKETPRPELQADHEPYDHEPKPQGNSRETPQVQVALDGQAFARELIRGLVRVFSSVAIGESLVIYSPGNNDPYSLALNGGVITVNGRVKPANAATPAIVTAWFTLNGTKSLGSATATMTGAAGTANWSMTLAPVPTITAPTEVTIHAAARFPDTDAMGVTGASANAHLATTDTIAIRLTP
jgi:hypothetical protein